MSISKTPIFNIKVVLNKTGIAADTLRAWERRYGLPKPQRTPGQHRLYSEYDIETIKWLMARQAEGLSISRAVELWNEYIASGTDPLASLPSSAFSSTLASTSAHSSLTSLRVEWIQACQEFDERSAEQILNQAFSLFPVEVVCIELIQKGLVEIGNLWYQNKLSVQQEHFASNLAMRRLYALLSAAPAPTRPQTLLTACPTGEWHTFPILLLTLLLRRRGWNVIYLGANVPIVEMRETLRTVRPALVILASQTLQSALTLRQMARAINSCGVKVAFGGRIFNHLPDLPQRIPGFFLANTVENALEMIEVLVNNSVLVPQEKAIEIEMQQLTEEYLSSRPQIEIRLYQLLNQQDTSPEYLDIAIRFLSETLAASLQLGSLEYLRLEFHWLVGLLVEHSIPLTHLVLFLEMYAAAVAEVMGNVGTPLVDFLKTEAAKSKAALTV